MHKIFPLLLLFLFFCLQAFSNNPKIDSLKLAAKSKTDRSEKLDLYLEIANEHLINEIRYDSAYLYILKVEKEATKFGLKEQLAKALLKKGFAYTMVDDFKGGITHFEQALVFFNETQDHRAISSCYNNLAECYSENQEYKKALDAFQLALEHVSADESLHRFGGYIKANIGKTYFEQGKLQRAKLIIKEGIQTLDSLGMSAQQPNFYLANVHFELEEYDEALKAAKIAYTIASDRKRNKEIYHSSLLLSEIYTSQENYLEATTYAKKAIESKELFSTEKAESDLGKAKLKGQLERQEEELASLERQALLPLITYSLVLIGVILISFLFYKQWKVTKLTENIHSMQKELIQKELSERDKKSRSVFDITKKGDQEFLNNKKDK